MTVTDALTYPFLFIAVFFEVFLLVTYLSAPARAARRKKTSTDTPRIAIIVPCFNEEKTVGGTVRSLLALEYPKDKLTLVLVNDGSTDGTREVMDEFAHEPGVIVIHKENGGKHSAMNLGIERVPDAEFIGCLDADSFVAPDALREVIGFFDDQKVAAVTAAMSVHEPKNLLELMQNADYISGITFRHIIASLNGLYVTPGPFSFYRRSILDEIGYFRKGYNTEDMEMALRIQRHGYKIENAPRARVYTKTPKTVRALVKQRTRWTTGFLRNVLYDYRDLIGNPKFGTLGLIMLPFGILADFSGILVFGVAIYQLFKSVYQSYVINQDLPLSYTLLPRFHGFDWYYLPISAILLLGLVGFGCTLAFMYIGKSISRTPGKLFVGVVAYTLLYGLISPFWLINSVLDFAFNIRRSWR